MGQFNVLLHHSSRHSWWNTCLHIVFLSHYSSPNSNKQTAQFYSWVLYRFYWLNLNLGMKFYKCFILLVCELDPFRRLRSHLTIKNMMVRANTKKHIPPTMNRIFIKRSQKSITSIYNLRERSIVPACVSFIPKTYSFGSPLACAVKWSREVLSLRQP